MPMAKRILLSDIFFNTFCSSVSDVNLDDYHEMLDRTYDIQCISYKDCMIDANSIVRRVSCPTTIFFHPILLFNFAYQLVTCPVAERDLVSKNQALFVAIKIVHEFSHLLHYHCSTSFRTYRKVTSSELITDKAVRMPDTSKINELQRLQRLTKMTSSEDRGEEVDKKDLAQSSQQNSTDISHQGPSLRSSILPLFREVDQLNIYSDLGELIEKAVFGGFIKLFNNAPPLDDDDDNNDDPPSIVMGIEKIGIYASCNARYGQYIDSVATVDHILADKDREEEEDNDDFKLITSEWFYSKIKLPSNFHRISLKRGTAAATRTSDPDVYEDRIDDNYSDDDDESNEGFIPGNIRY